jgi:hypothetical protein
MKNRYVVTCNTPEGNGKTRAQECATQADADGIVAAMTLGVGAGKLFSITVRRIKDGSLIKNFGVSLRKGHVWANPYSLCAIKPTAGGPGPATGNTSLDGGAYDSVDAAVRAAIELRRKLAAGASSKDFLYVGLRHWGTSEDIVTWTRIGGKWRRHGPKRPDREWG